MGFIDDFRKRRDDRIAVKKFTERRSDRIAVVQYRKRREERIQTRMDADNDNWKTIKGTHVLVGEGGDIVGGPSNLKGKSFEGIKKTARKNAAKKSAAKTVENNSPQSKDKNSIPRSEKAKRVARSVTAAFARLRRGSEFGKEFKGTAKRTMHVANPYYLNSEEVVKKRPDLRLYSNHTSLHIEEVAKKSFEAADVIDNADLPSEHYGKIDRHELLAAALWHDTGMDGDSREYEDNDSGDLKMRKEHPLNSAIHVLENRQAIADMGLDPDKLALDVLGHSKSMSKIKRLTNEDDWCNAFKRLEEACDEYNAKVPKDKQIHFNASNWAEKDADGNYRITNKENLAQSAATIAALRLGDANRDASDEPTTQGGSRVDIDWNSYDPTAKDSSEERSRANVFYTDNDGNKIKVGEGNIARSAKAEQISAGIHIGENNLRSINTMLSDGHVTESIELIDPTRFPHCTKEAIGERIGELNTIDGIPSRVVIKVPGVRRNSKAAKKLERLYDLTKYVDTDADISVEYLYDGEF